MSKHFLMRCSSSYCAHALLLKYVQKLKEGAAKIGNNNFDVTGWLQEKLSARYEGIGLRSHSDFALPAYLFLRVSLVLSITLTDMGQRSSSMQ